MDTRTAIKKTSITSVTRISIATVLVMGAAGYAGGKCRAVSTRVTGAAKRWFSRTVKDSCSGIHSHYKLEDVSRGMLKNEPVGMPLPSMRTGRDRYRG